ncbi:lysophospholipase L1 [Rubidibacter lacunae KORDI 51-2]|uniref:Lysophospholipase L1 n=1 Tax=Rubidibacter lacunae KORDI 51-2 TaxID=582515 RepID=U5DE65_9CHRO|nr:GDSL-type esterase/lipase family protein [Rubidibacter lacunae]ERN39911.1 lysophospholipase L1 [Rubidibacter lacunae KORDI 51-2]
MYVLFIGDSFVNGTGDPDYLGWTGRLCQRARHRGEALTAYNLGVRGDTSTDIRTRWEQEVNARVRTDLEIRLVFSFGTNDTMVQSDRPRVPPGASVENARAILTAARARFPVLMVGPPAIVDRGQNRRTAALSSEFAALCAELDIPYLDALTPTSRSPIWMGEVAAGDGAHPHAAGYEELAAVVARWPEWQLHTSS